MLFVICNKICKIYNANANAKKREIKFTNLNRKYSIKLSAFFLYIVSNKNQ